jgi:hypothetical protein
VLITEEGVTTEDMGEDTEEDMDIMEEDATEEDGVAMVMDTDVVGAGVQDGQLPILITTILITTIRNPFIITLHINMELEKDFKEALPESLKVIKNLLRTDGDFVSHLIYLKAKDPKAYELCVVGNVKTNMANEDYIRVIKEGRYPTWMCWM